MTPLAMKPFDFSFPNRSLLYETIRNLNFHVPMWFTMMLLQLVAVSTACAPCGATACATTMPPCRP